MKLQHVSSSPDDLISFLEGLRKALKVSVVADLLGFGKQTIYIWIERGHLQAFDFDGSIRIDPKELARFLRSRRTIVEMPNADQRPSARAIERSDEDRRAAA